MNLVVNGIQANASLRIARASWLTHQGRLKQCRGRKRARERKRQQLTHAGRTRKARKPKAAECCRGYNALKNTARVRLDCRKLVSPRRQAKVLETFRAHALPVLLGVGVAFKIYYVM